MLRVKKYKKICTHSLHNVYPKKFFLILSMSVPLENTLCVGACHLVQLYNMCVCVHDNNTQHVHSILYYVVSLLYVCFGGWGKTEIARREANGVTLCTIRVTFDVMSHMKNSKHTQNKCNYKIFMQPCNEYTL